MWPFTQDEELDEVTSDFEAVAQSIFEQAETEEAGLFALQDAFRSYEFENPKQALDIFQDKSSSVRKKFGDTNSFDPITTLNLAPINFDSLSSDKEDPTENQIDIINQWEESNLKELSNAEDLNYVQLRPQLERSIKQLATIKRRGIYGSDNYLVTDQALRLAQGAIGPIASLVGADSVNDFFTENTDPDGSSVFGYTIGGDESYWSAISSGLGSVAGAVGAGVATGGWGTVGYLGASGAGAVRERVEDALENEASLGEAAAAGGIEALSQAGQVAVGSKVFGGAVNKILGRSPTALGRSPTALGEKVFPKLLKAGTLEGTTEAAGQVVSNIGENVGRGEDLDKDLLSGVSQSFVAGFVGGGLATGAAEFVGNRTEAISKTDIEVTNKQLKGEASLDILPDEGFISQPGKGSLNYVSINDDTYLITTLGVYPDQQNQGVGGQLLDQFIDQAKKSGKKKIILEAIADTESLQPRLEDFYKRRGFEFTGEGKEMVLDLFPVDPLLETEGTKPPPQEAVKGKTVSAEPIEPGVPIADLEDGSQIVQADGNYHLVKEGKTLQSYDTVRTVSPEIAQKLRQLEADGQLDGKANTLTTDGENLFIESEFINEDLTASKQKTGKLRVVVPSSQDGQGTAIFVSKTRTTDGVRQNPFFISPSDIQSMSAAKAGFGDQYVSPYMKRMTEKFGPDLAEDLGLIAKSFEEAADGTRTEVVTPLQTKFKTSHSNQGDNAVTLLNEKDVLEILDHLNSSTRFNDTDVAVSNIITSKLETLYTQLQNEFSQTQDPKVLNRWTLVGNLLGEAVMLSDKVHTSGGRTLGAMTDKARAIHNARMQGEFRVSQLEAEMNKAAYSEYQKETGEEVNIQGWAEEAQQAEKEINKLTPKEGEPVSASVQSELNKAKERYDNAVNKIKKVEDLRQKKLSKLTPEEKTNLIDMYELLGSLDGEMKFKYAEAVFDKEVELGIKDLNKDTFESLFNFFRANLLSGLSTQLRNLVGNSTKVLSDIVGLIGSGNFKEAGVFLDQWLKGSKLGLKEGKEILRGNRVGRFKLDQKVTDTSSVKKAAPLTNPLTAVQNAMYRVLTFQDAVFYRGANSSMAYLAEYVANKHITDPKERAAAIEKALGYTERDSILEQVTKEAEMLKAAGMDISQNQIDLDVAYRMERLRSERTQEIADKFGQRSVFTNDPTGVIGALYKGVEAISDFFTVPVGNTTVKPLKFFLPFTRVAANVTSHIMEFTPIIGTLKAIKNDPNAAPSALNHQLSDLDAQMVLGRSVVGTSLMAAFYAFADAFKDDEDPDIYFYGYPPKGKWKEWQAKNITPFSMKIGNNIIPLQGTSLAIIPAILGGAIEAEKSGANKTDVLKAAAVASLGAVATMSFIKPAGELYEFMSGVKDFTAGEEVSGTTAKRQSNFLKNQADLLISGFIPASGFLNNIGRWMNQNPVETYNNLTAKILGDMPYSFGTDTEPQLNMFGEPITKSLLERFSAGLAPHTMKTDPVLLWMTETTFTIPDQGPIFSLTRKNEKEIYGESQKNLTGYANILNEEQSRRVLQISGPRIKEFLESIRKDPNFQVKGEKAQKYINEVVNDIRAEAKLLVLSNP